MKRKLSAIYAVCCTLLLGAGFLLAFYFAWGEDVDAVIECLVGLAVGFVLSPTLHELGHIAFAEATAMRIVFAKFFCFKIYEKQGKLRLAFASPFAADQTQAIPNKGGDMKKRAAIYTLGGLIFGGAFLAVILAAAIVCTALGATSFYLWGVVPYAAYLFLLNVLPVEYASGKTDALVYRGIKKGYDAEKTMLAAMEIQGRLAEGYGFSELEESLYYDAPQLCEEEPLFAVMLDLRYRYHLEKGELERAADALNRLAFVEPYLTDAEVEKIAAELVYMHSINGDLQSAEENGAACKEYLKGESATAKRVLAAFSAAFGKKEEAKVLVDQARNALEKERIAGVKKFESVLLSRIKTDEEENS
ncbi:MAG: hypothetical protein IJ514_04495 [Clostridia bacterium]|nr:hypothetical protein [Clostridia bacterium]